MNDNTVNQNQPTVNAKPITITSTAWAWGFEDGAQNVTVYNGYHFFAGAKLTEYKRGWAEGRKARSR